MGKKTFGVATVLIGSFGNRMVTITTHMKNSLEHSTFLWIISAIFRSPAKSVQKRCLKQPKLAGLPWQSCGHQQNWYEKTLGAAKVRISYFGVLMDYNGNLQVTSKIGTEETPGTTTVLIGYVG